MAARTPRLPPCRWTTSSHGLSGGAPSTAAYASLARRWHLAASLSVSTGQNLPARSYSKQSTRSSMRLSVDKTQCRQLSLGRLSPTAMRIYALRLQAESMPEDAEKHLSLFTVLLESGDKDNAAELVRHYEQYSGLYASEPANPSLLQDQKAFDMYLAALAIANSGQAVTKLAQASQRRDAILASPTVQEAPVEQQASAPPEEAPRPSLTDAQIASAVLSRGNPTANVRVVNGPSSDSPVSDAAASTSSTSLPTSASPAASNMTEQIQQDKSTPQDSKPAEADLTATPAGMSSPAPTSSLAAAASLGGSSTSGSSGSSSASSTGSASQSNTASGNSGRSAGAAGEPIRVVVEEAKGNLVLRTIAWLGRTLFLTFLTLTLLSFMIDQSGIMRGRAGSGGPTEFLPPASGKTYKFTDVHGCEEAKSELEEVVEFLKDPKKFSKLGGKLPRGVLLTGPPGTGKTLLARAVAGEAGVKFLFASGSEFDEMYVGVGARRVRELFTAAKQSAPAIIFIDELDAVGGKRSPKNMQYSQQTLNELLVQLDGFTQTEGVILIGATNFPESLDKALIRPGRFDRHITVPLPDVRGRLAILKHHLSEVLYNNAIDVSVLARGTPGFSGAELQNLVNQAAVHAARAGKVEVGARDLEWAKDRVMLGSERRSAVITPEDKRLTAFHEAGHALVALMTEGSTPLHSVTCLPRGASLGLTHFLPTMDVTNQTFKELQAHLDVAFGGRVAEELIYGKLNITTGAHSDISQATKIANSMVRHYGYSDLVGPVNVADNDIISPSTRSTIDAEVRRMLEEAKVRATEVLTRKSVELERLANALIEYETLNKEEVLKVIKGEKINKSVT